jgi:MscS family membrane protein
MMKKLIIYCFIIISTSLIFYSLFASAANTKNEVKLDNPFNSVSNHLNNLQKENYHPEIAVKSFNIIRMSPANAQETAVKLKRIFNGLGLYVDYNKLPQDDNYIDSVTGEKKFTLFKELPGIYLEKYGNKWLYSSSSVAIIDELYSSTYKFDSFTFIETLSPVWQNSFLGIYLWQSVGFVLILICCFLLYYCLKWILGYLLVKISAKFFKHGLYLKYVKPISKPISLLLITVIFSQSIILLGLPTKISYFLWFIIKILQPIFIAIIAYKLIDFVVDIMALLASKTASTVDDHLVPFLRKGMHALIIVLGTLYLLGNIGIDITPLIAGVSIGGLAIALAAQDTVKHLFGSLTIFTDQPFMVGDLIVVEGAEGVVEEIGIRSTRIRTLYNSLVTIPNGKLSDAKIDNMGKREMRRFSTKISITYDTSPELIELFVDGLRKIIENHEFTKKDNYQVSLYDLSDSAILILLHVFFDVADWGPELKARHEIISEIIKLADKLGVKFAFPTRSIFIENLPDKTIEKQIKEL